MKYYVKKLMTIKKIVIWQVDGNYIRNNKDVNFNNAGHHFIFDYIPVNEIWIDKDFSSHEKVELCYKVGQKVKCTNASKDEEELIEQTLEERCLIKHGMSYNDALEISSKNAQKRRRDENGIPLSKTYDNVYVKKIPQFCMNGVKVWLIYGKLVRDNLYKHFTQGGHHYVYKWVPKNEIWIDDNLNPKEYGYVLFHEAIERNLMKYNKMNYESAHGVAIAYEGILREKKVDPTDIIVHEIKRSK